MLLPFWEGLVPTMAVDPEMRMLADRHYSRVTVGHREFVGPGRKLVLRDCAGDVVFAWLWCFDEMRLDGQTGYNCTIFRNESGRRSSDIIREAEQHATAKWGPNRFYTYVDPRKVRSSNPGYCFQAAGWQKTGRSKSGLLLLAKDALQRDPAKDLPGEQQ